KVDKRDGGANGVAVGLFERALLHRSGGGGRLPCPIGSAEARIPFLDQIGVLRKVFDAKFSDESAVDGQRAVWADAELPRGNLDRLITIVGLLAENLVALIGNKVAALVEAEAAVTRVTQAILGEHSEETGPLESDVGFVASGLDGSLREIEARSAKNAEGIDGW